MKNKNRVSSFDVFVRLDEQISSTEESSLKMLKSKMKSIAFNASSATSLIDGNPSMEIEGYIAAKIAVAADYLETIEEYFRNYEGGDSTSTTDPGMGDDLVGAPDLGMDDADPTLGEDDDVTAEDEDGEEPGDSSDDETEDEIEDAPQEEE